MRVNPRMATEHPDFLTVTMKQAAKLGYMAVCLLAQGYECRTTLVAFSKEAERLVDYVFFDVFDEGVRVGGLGVKEGDKDSVIIISVKNCDKDAESEFTRTYQEIITSDDWKRLSTTHD